MRRSGRRPRCCGSTKLLERRPGEISGGQKQRTALARTLVARPEVYLLDEPISHLDARIRHELRQQFHGLEELRRVATLYVTHDYAEALSLADRIGVMGAGGLVQVGTARDIFERPASLFVAQHLGQPSINVVEAELRQTGDDGAVHWAATGVAGGKGLTLPVADAHRAALSNLGTATVMLGIRPQFVSVLGNTESAAARTGDGSDTDVAARNGRGTAGGGLPVIDATVELYEPLGATGVLIADAGGRAAYRHHRPGPHVPLRRAREAPAPPRDGALLRCPERREPGGLTSWPG